MLKFRWLYYGFGASTVFLFSLGLGLSWLKVGGDITHRFVSCGDGIFHWQVIFSQLLLLESIVMNALFFGLNGRLISVTSLSKSQLLMGASLCLLLVGLIADAVLGYEFQCGSMLYGSGLRYATFTLGMNIFHAALFLLCFQACALGRGLKVE